MRRSHSNSKTVLANFALTFAKAMLVVALMLFLMISPPTKQDDGVKPKIEYLISMDWPGNLDYDVDIWMRDPNGNLLSYGKKEVGFLTLERDDMGSSNNTIEINGQLVTKLTNEELVSIRGFLPGEYIVNVHLYSAKNNMTYGAPVEPFPVTIKIQKMNPTVTIVYQGTVTLKFIRQEVHAVRFTLSSDGSISNINNDLPIMIRNAPDPGTNITITH